MTGTALQRFLGRDGTSRFQLYEYLGMDGAYWNGLAEHMYE